MSVSFPAAKSRLSDHGAARRDPLVDWGELVQAHGYLDVFQVSPDELAVIDIHRL